ncbi:chromosome partitioning protein ParA [Jannaschia pagri]|uniref:Chromosome partitioning protein ParA n=1 Tax=Jannaschia pagri TaxID=2829797 RepID=A0ABQ4NLJ8_9RHOB|nr:MULTISPECIES: AAA family ATPase [unclassified Jannaschia]GIT91452.1 chromosome partitioning protein ParA [Jannaschia sp. AI_61]GIT95286.1 chromosome partitioning protein ParA [Jannaschia sp. AI_62]
MKTPKIFSIANQKGGVGKTTTAINLGAALAVRGAKVLIIDLDPQGNASTGLGISRETRTQTVYDLLLGQASAEELAKPTDVENLWIIPATMDLSSADAELMSTSRRVVHLRNALRHRDAHYDYILIDCPPSLNLLTVNAFVASDSVIVPLQAEFFALEGLSQLLLTVREVRETANADLRIEGIVLTMFDRRNNLCLQVEEDARANLGDLVFETVIPRNVRLSEAPSYAMPVLNYDPTSRGAIAYKALASEVFARNATSQVVENV